MARRTLVAAASVATSLVLAGSALAANPVTGLTVQQGEGFATLAWTPVAGASDYQIERAVVNADGTLGTASIVGLWQGQRTITPSAPRFAEAGFALGGTYQWRVRARFGTTPQDWSDPVVGTTRPQWGSGPGASLRTQWETSGNATFTTHANELAYTAALDAASDRVRTLEIGRTNPVPSAPTGREINMLVVGYPAPPATAAEISGRRTILYYCNVHGNEPQGRESCLIFARMLAFTEDPHLLQILSETTVLIIPSSNPNGRAANTRGNETGTDLNRDHAELTQPETKALAAVVRDYTPEVAIDLHEGDTEDLPILTSRHLNVFEGLFDEGKLGLVEGWLYDNAAVAGWWAGPYSNGGDSNEGILRNTLGLKNVVGMLAESRPNGGTTRPAEGTQLANRNRKSYASLWQEFQLLEYYWTRRNEIGELIQQSIVFQKANVGRVVLRGSYPWPHDPRLGANMGLPDEDAPLASRIIDPAPCGYFVTEPQYSGDLAGGTLALRLGLHGVAVDHRPAGHIVRLAQQLRGLIPMLLDAASVAPQPIVAAGRLFECPHVTAAPRTYSLAAVEEMQTTASLTIGNDAVEADEPLNWTITEAQSDCASPSDVGWLSTDVVSGTTPSGGGSSTVTLTASAAGLLAPTRPSALLCVTSNDAGESVIAIPVTFQVQYAFTGFFSPVANPPTLNTVGAGSTLPLKFVVAGNSDLSIVEGGSPTSQELDCETLALQGEPTAITTPGSSGFRYSDEDSAYHANWKTDRAWAGTCRAMSVALDDGTRHAAYFRFE